MTQKVNAPCSFSVNYHRGRHSYSLAKSMYPFSCLNTKLEIFVCRWLCRWAVCRPLRGTLGSVRREMCAVPPSHYYNFCYCFYLYFLLTYFSTINELGLSYYTYSHTTMSFTKSLCKHTLCSSLTATSEMKNG